MTSQPLLQSLRGFRVLYLPHSQAVIANQFPIYQTDVGLSGSRSLVLKSMLQQPRVQVCLAAVERG